MPTSITSAEKAPLLDQDDVQLTADTVNVATSDANVAGVDYQSGPIFITGLSAGTSTITAHRFSDNQDATLEVTVTAAPFTISLGPAVPR